jgi:hypothetical protein
VRRVATNPGDDPWRGGRACTPPAGRATRHLVGALLRPGVRTLQTYDRGRRGSGARDVPLGDLGEEDSGSDRGFEQGEDRQGCRQPHRFSARRAAERVEGALVRGEGIPLPLPGCHLPEGALEREGHDHGAFGVRRGARRAFGMYWRWRWWARRRARPTPPC